MKSLKFFVVVLVSMFLGMLPVYGQQTAEQLYQSGIYKEEIQGDLNAAIKIFESIINQYPENRFVAAKTQLHIGLCYEKLGNTEARKAYERVLLKYSDQGDIATQARIRLTALAETVGAVNARVAKDLTHTKKYAGSAYAASMSPDGKRLALIRPELASRDIWIRDIMTGKEVRLTNFINSSADVVWSPDNLWIAFADQDRDIKVVSTEGGPLRTLFTSDLNSRETAGITPTGWTSDSRKVIFHVPSKGLFVVPASGGVSEPVFTFESSDESKRYEAMTLSPDGRWIAYSAVQNGNTDIFVMSLATQVPIRITVNPAADRNPRWSLDGNWLSFTSYGTENPQIWAIKISPNGGPDGSPVQISKDAHVLGGDWTSDASIGFSAAFRTEHIFTANIDGTGETQVTQFASFNTAPQWSPNGNKIAFRSDYRKPLNKFQLWTVSLAGGTPRLVSDKEVGNFLWSMDGEKLFFKKGAGNDRSVYMEVPAGGGEPKEIMPLPGKKDDLSRSPDGRRIGFTFTVEPTRFATSDEYLKERLSGIGVTLIDDGEPRILIPADKKGIWYSDCRLDPEGKRIAYIKFDYAQYGKEGMNTIWTMELNGGTPRQITRGGEYSLCWSPDAKWIVFEKRINDMDFELYKVPANGGEPVKMNIKGRSPEFSPDGKKIAYSRRVESGYEYWLVENFAAQARARLTGAAGESKSPTLAVRRVWAGADVTGKVSPDGRLVSCTVWETGDIGFHDLITGQTRRLTDGSNPDAIIESSVPSPDGKSIAYYWSNNDSYDLRVIGLDGSKPKVLKSSGKEIHHIIPIAWSPDSKQLLSEFVKGDGSSQMMLLTVADGSARLLKEKGKGLPSDGDFSPDGRYIAWSTREGISMFELQTGNESLLIQDQSNHSVLGWAPDGKYVMFSSERAGSSDAWLIAVADGKGKGEPIFIKKNWGFQPMGLTHSGAFYYAVNNNVWGIKIATLDPFSGKVVTPLQSAFKHGNMRSPDWSPDGHFLAGVDANEPSQAVIIHSMETGEERELKVGEWKIGMGQLRWTPDGKAIVVPASQAGKGENLIRIDVQTGQVTSLMTLPALGGWVHFSFSKDGNIIYYTRPDSSNMNEFTPVAHDLRSGKETEFTTEQGNVSPDGLFRLISKSLDGYKTQSLYIKSVDGGEERELVNPSRIWASWAPDSRYIVFLKEINADEQVPYKDTKWQLWRVATEGGEPEPLGLNFTGQFVGSLKISPDGRYVVIDDVVVNLEVWVMENFLPK